jgi:acyl-CoA thioesterase
VEFTRTLGIQTTRTDDGECRIEIEIQPIHLSQAERAHGGFLFTLLDTAMGRAVLSTLPAGRGCATLECKINYLRPVQEGALVTIGKVVNVTRSTAYAEGSITNAEGRLVACSSGTFFLTETLVQTERERL